MSQKITSKNLSYDSSLPPFLARMQAQASGHDDTPSQSQQRNRRLGKKRSGSEEAEDAPLVVDEEGNLVEVEIDKEGGVKRPDGDAEGGNGQGDEEEVVKEKEGDRKGVEIGMRKRKAGRVVGGNDEDGDRAESRVDNKEKVEDVKGDGRKKGKKKAKKIKLSFDEEEG